MSKRPIEGDDDGGRDGGAASPEEKRAKSAAAAESINQYAGWTVPSNGYVLPSVDAADVTPREFYSDFVGRRRPVVLRGIPEDLSSIAKWKDAGYLERKVGGESVAVERRASASDPFGRGNEVRMSFAKFLRLMEGGDDMHYLTTQDVRANPDGRPELTSPLMAGLASDFPLRPALMGNLVPQNVNMWMGNNKRGASSGLHHDYHDNLYVVLRGRKRFRLYSPRDAGRMRTRGELLRVHPNGRINYVGEETTAYGADLHSDAAARAARRREEAEKRLADAERAVEEGGGDAGAREELERAEEELEDAMDAVLDAEIGDDDDDDDCDGDGMGETDDYGNDDDRLVDKTVKDPNNFSTVEVDILDDKEKLERQYPDMLEAKAAYCDIKAGSALYLPASWFHEVTSYGGDAGGHLAVNYWFHPPDGDSFDAPYSTDFWPNDYRDRLNDRDA